MALLNLDVRAMPKATRLNTIKKELGCDLRDEVLGARAPALTQQQCTVTSESKLDPAWHVDRYRPFGYGSGGAFRQVREPILRRHSHGRRGIERERRSIACDKHPKHREN